ncbi:MAG: sigma-54-dependent Fis family transcriptional regulator [Marinilabiliaceae bacterium]|nr:sigma-54-dependent Fis family transcriptional regulator [Marinilabiliaceae bacterium]
MTDARILIADDNKSVLSALQFLLEDMFKHVKSVSNPNVIPHELETSQYDVVLLDMNFKTGQNTGNEGLYWLSEIKKRDPHLTVILITAYGDVDLAVKAIKEGATDFILKPWDNQKLVATLQTAIKLTRSNRKVTKLEHENNRLLEVINQPFSPVIGTSEAMRQVMDIVKKVAATDANILLLGENGTGKELIAREIHRLSARSKEVLITVDMGAIAESLFESELFGHEKGAFTDAKNKRIGKFEAADKGNLFLDEIANLNSPLQAKLLSVLQSRTITPVGGNQPVPVDIRLITATNRHLPMMIEEGLFREDLFFRINTIQIEIPPLRERDGDVELLTNFYLEKYCQKYNKPLVKLSSGALKKLKTYHWPGNVRELQHAIEKAVILSDGRLITDGDFSFNPSKTSTMQLPNTMEEMEQLMITNALKKSSGNLSAAAIQLGITRQTLYNKMNKYDL